ncbi:hypothetical protein F5B20DRAFT_540499 [Whalleya microplaca]|nr:hypothetical protein F5B20DRAFT_540499 [Whalleya microplaca]
MERLHISYPILPSKTTKIISCHKPINLPTTTINIRDTKEQQITTYLFTELSQLNRCTKKHPAMSQFPSELYRLKEAHKIYKEFQEADQAKQVKFLQDGWKGFTILTGRERQEMELSFVLRKQALFLSLPREEQLMYLEELMRWLTDYGIKPPNAHQEKYFVIVAFRIQSFVHDLRTGAINEKKGNWFRWFTEREVQGNAKLLDQMVQNEAIRNESQCRERVASRQGSSARRVSIASMLNAPDEKGHAGAARPN